MDIKMVREDGELYLNLADFHEGLVEAFQQVPPDGMMRKGDFFLALGQFLTTLETSATV